MFELLLVEWHLSPEYIVDNWTDEKLQVMTHALIERYKRQTGGDGTADATGDAVALLPGVAYEDKRPN